LPEERLAHVLEREKKEAAGQGAAAFRFIDCVAVSASLTITLPATAGRTAARLAPAARFTAVLPATAGRTATPLADPFAAERIVAVAGIFAIGRL